MHPRSCCLVVLVCSGAVSIAAAQAAPAPASAAAGDPRAAATYLPLVPGTAWSYRSTWQGDDGKAYEANWEAVVWGDVPLGVGDATCTQILFAGSGQRVEYWLAGPTGLVQFDNRYVGGERGVDASGSIRWLAAPVGADTRWQWDDTMGCNVMGHATPDPASLRVHHEVELLAFDTEVTVPAGTFRCVHVRVTDRNDGWPAPHVREAWFGRGVGLVRLVDSQIGDRTLVAFRPGVAVTTDREQRLRAAVAAAKGASVAGIEWLPAGDWSFHVRGAFAVVVGGDGARTVWYADGDAVVPFRAEDAAFWQQRAAATTLRIEPPAGAGAGRQDVAFRAVDFSLARLAECALRVEALRRGWPAGAECWSEQTISDREVQAKVAIDVVDGAVGRRLRCTMQGTGGDVAGCEITVIDR